MNISETPPATLQLYSRFLHWLPVSSGLTPLSFNRLIDPLFSHCPKTVVAQMLNGILMDVDPLDYHGRILYLFGTNDPKVQAVTQGLLAPGDRFLDIGANYASIGLLAADSVGPNGQVHLFEPQPHLCEAVSNAIQRAHLTNVRLHPIGLFDRDDTLTLMRPQHHSGMATLVEREDVDPDTWETVKVPVKEISAYVKPLIGDVPFGVKIDVEGAEPILIPWLLQQPNLKFLVFEAAHHQATLWKLIQGSGLRLYGLRRLVFGKRLRAVTSFAEMAQYHDLVAIRNPEPLPPDVSVWQLAQRLKGEQKSVGNVGVSLIPPYSSVRPPE